MCDRGLICLYLCAEAGLAGVLRELPFCLDHVVVGQPHYRMEVCIPAPPRQAEVAICGLGSFWLGVRGRILRLLGHWSIYH